jgi:hypothetical protein
MHRQVLTVALLSLLLSASAAGAKVFSYPALNCRCEIPNSWFFQSKLGYLLYVVDSDHKRGFWLRACPFGSDANQKSILLKRLDILQETNGFVIISKDEITLHGTLFYEESWVKDMGNRSLYSTVYFAVARNVGYLMGISKFEGNPADDEELKAIIASFDLIDPNYFPSEIPSAVPPPVAPANELD